MIFFTPEIVKYVKVKLDKNETSLQWTNSITDFTVFRFFFICGTTTEGKKIICYTKSHMIA